MKFGQFEIYPVVDGRFRLDGGAMFGVVPKVLWERCCPADEQNRIELALNCLLIRAHGKNILVDTGLGEKQDEKFRRMFAVERRPTLQESLKAVGLEPTDIDMVINTHLHFDHAGGNTMKGENGKLTPAFSRAKFFVQAGEFEEGVHPSERTKASYRQENILPVADHDRWELLDGETEILPGISVVVTDGHTRHHQGVRIESEGQIAFYLGDLIPTVSHLPLPYIMGYDLFPLQTLEAKRRILDKAFAQQWLLLFEHDPKIQMGRVRKDGEGKYLLQAA